MTLNEMETKRKLAEKDLKTKEVAAKQEAVKYEHADDFEVGARSEAG
jgi:hypothetical protein